MSTMDEVISKQERATKAAIALSKKTDPEELRAGAEKLKEMTDDLEKACKRLQAEFAGGTGHEERVVLTPDQRERLAESTGVPMDMLVVQDRDGSFGRRMPTTDRATIERMAALQAAAITEKKAKTAAVEKLIKQLEKLEVPELQPIIDSIRKDPTLADLVKQQEAAAIAVKEQAAENEKLLPPKPPGT
jgi:hypothetical protein